MGGIPYPILSDYHPHGEAAKKYGLFDDSSGTFSRAIVIVDKQGIVRFARTYASPADLQVSDILAEVDKLA